MKEIDITGERFGRLVAVDRVREPGWERTRWRLRCDCGGETVVKPGLLKRGNVQSCGCLRKENAGAMRRTHGLSKTIEHNAWTKLRDRCFNPLNAKYADYGGRGITVCERWDSFENFLEDMGERPRPSLSIDRKDNNGNYEPGNCRWATAQQQSANRRPSSEWTRKKQPDKATACEALMELG